ncbi:DUF58 domain-containing protein [Ferrimonas lipolytica]|uniref:DUF58 domain-containing protein n=1 Tax=Ferrimonas lipolytica TaxID=2724191 RepID=A0A6H1UG84_9GAMM|nr:DUF58 domain-containing protein [Ferrimonas lipolytica]QIZ77226.1 DUF58 domain-containing protein [Ferrimonas lipolytica]
MLALPRHSDGVQVTLPELIARAEHQGLIRSHHTNNAKALQAGERLSRLKGRGMEFAEVRAYQYGDDVRSIDWRVTARTGKAHTKLFRDEREQPVLLCVDLGSRMQLGSKLVLQAVQAAHLAATIGWHVSNQGDRLGGIIVNETDHSELKPRARRGGLLPLLESMVELQPTTEHNNDYWQQALERLHRLARAGSQVVIITNPLGFDEASMQQIRRLRQHAQVRLFCITDPLFEQLAQQRHSLPVRLPNHDSNSWLDNAGSTQLANRWHQAQQNAERFGRQHQLPITEISAAIPLEQQWQKLWL